MTARSEILRVLAAGSLRRAFAAVAERFVLSAPEIDLRLRHGPAGLLREEIEAGTAFDLFASADMEHPRRLEMAGLATAVSRFAGNTLVATVRADLAFAPHELIETLLRLDVRLATSTPGADPSGDYAERFFANVEADMPGVGKALQDKALRLVGGRDTPPVPAGRAAAAWLIASGQADVALGYGSHSAANLAEGGVRIVGLPERLAPKPSYGLALRPNAGPATRQLRDYLLSPPGQTVLVENGFVRVDA